MTQVTNKWLKTLLGKSFSFVDGSTTDPGFIFTINKLVAQFQHTDVYVVKTLL